MDHATVPSPDAPSESLEDLLVRIRPKIRQMLANYRIPFPDAEDVVQEALLAACLKKGDQIRSLEFWLLGTLRYKCAFYWRKQGGNLLRGVDPLSLEELSPPQPPDQEREMAYWDLDTVSRTLGEKNRELLWLRFRLGLTHEEMAERLGFGPEDVRRKIASAVTRARRRMNRKPGARRTRRPLD